MHAQEDRAHAGPTRAARSPGPVSAPSSVVTAGGTADRLLTLQRLAGNAAVSRAVAEERHEHDAGCGHAPQVQRRALVHEVLRSPGEGMEPGLRNEMEARFDGADFSGVRVHRSALARDSAAELQAKAYTSGPNIVVGGALTKEDWAHELTHYQDQLTGPVPGTDNGGGARVSDPADSGERHAVDNARRVMNGPVPRIQRTPGEHTDSAAGGGVAHTGAVHTVAAPVQRVLDHDLIEDARKKLGITGAVKIVEVPGGVRASAPFAEYPEGHVTGLAGAELNLSVQQLNNWPDGDTPASSVVDLAGGGGYLPVHGIILVNSTPAQGHTTARTIQHEMGHVQQHEAGFNVDMSGGRRALVEYHNMLVNENRFDGEMRIIYESSNTSSLTPVREAAREAGISLANPWNALVAHVRDHDDPAGSQQQLLTAITTELADEKYDEIVGRGLARRPKRDKIKEYVGRMYFNELFKPTPQNAEGSAQ